MNRLEAIGTSIWLAEGDIVDFYGFPYPTRSLIIQLANGDLWIWSPIRLEPDLAQEVEALGPVTHLVSPNKIHHLYLQDWQVAYPRARLWGPQSTIDKRTDLRFEAALTDTSPPDWQNEIDQFWFTGSPALDEMVFFHRASRTAILADLSENFTDTFLREHWRLWQRTIARWWKIVEPFGYAPLELRLSWFKRAAARKALGRLLESDPEQVIVAHGEWQREGGKAYLQSAFRWLAKT